MNTKSHASTLIGPRPKGALGRISRSLYQYFVQLTAEENKPTVIIACSGGADSLALAACSIDIGTRLGIPIFTVTVDHQIRPESTAEAHQVASTLTALGATQAKVISVQLGDKNGPEASARDARQEALLQAAVQLCPDRKQVVILFGHTLDDQGETVLLRLARGSGTNSLAAIAPKVRWREGVNFIRPLLHIRRADTQAACAQLGLTPVEDPTNSPTGPWRAADGSALRRAAVREWVLPQLNAALGQDVGVALARTAHLARRDEEALVALAAQVFSKVQVAPSNGAAEADGEGLNYLCLDGKKLRSQLPAITTRVLRKTALKVGADGAELGFERIEELEKMLRHGRGGTLIELPGQVRVRQNRGLIEFFGPDR